MTDVSDTGRAARLAWPTVPRRFLLAHAVLLVEGLLLYFVYTTDLFGLTEDRVPDALCHAFTNGFRGCQSGSHLASRPLLLITVLLVLSLIPQFRRRYVQTLQAIEARRQSPLWLAASAGGTIIVASAYLVVAFAGVEPSSIGPIPIAAGVALMVGGVCYWLVDPFQLGRTLGLPILIATVTMLLMPELSGQLSATLWRNDALQGLTFNAAAALLNAVAFHPVTVWPDEAIIQVGDFAARVGHPCAGLSGIAFSTLAMSVYIFAARHDLRISRALLALPFVALASWCLNAVRIAVLMLIGASVSPDLAQDGFHSYAGWIAFTLITGGAILVIDRVRWFHAPAGPQAADSHDIPFFRDPVSARILPFAVFLLTSLVAGAVFEAAETGYPLRVILTGAVLVAFWRCLPADLDLRPRLLPVLAGTVIAVFWIAAQDGDGQSLRDTVPGVAGVALVIWVAFRLLGTSVLVPVVEELFFRGYLLRRLTVKGRYGWLLGVMASSALFAVVHDEIILGFLAGVIFALVTLRSGRVWDAILAHAMANALIGLWALGMNDWSVI